MAGILKVDKYQDFNGNDIMTSDGAGNITINNAALKNTPAFSVYLTSATTLTNNTLTKVSFDTENYDTNNAVSSGTFTVPAGQAGKYFIYAQLSIGCTSQSSAWIYKNGSIVTFNIHQTSGNYLSDVSTNVSASLDLNVSDYIEIYARATSSGTPTLNGGGASNQRCTFLGYKLIGA